MKTLTGYERTIHEIDPSINAVGVECSMRVQFGTLDHLDRQTFRNEIALAREMEREQPGVLKMIAGSYGREQDYEDAERHVSRIVRPANRVARPGRVVLA